MEHEERNCHKVENRRRAQYKEDYGHPEEGALNEHRHTRSQVVAPAQSRGGTQARVTTDDMAITTFLVLAPRLRSVAYPNNFKPNIQNYNGRSEPNI
jgi:hypothetical protein